ncbi:MAG: GAF domain-containing sensor histidine kinase [Solirubrobacteraceae bacterium]
MAVDAEPVPVAVSALDAFAEVLAEADAGASRDGFYGRLCEVICRLGSMQRAVLFRYDEVARRVRAAGAHNLDLSIFDRAHVNVESAPIARRALEADEVVDAVPPWSDDLPAEFVSLLGNGRLFCVPMAASGRWIGVVLCDRPGRRDLSERQRNLLWTLGKSAALAAMARIATSEGARAHELQQRIDLAREVHDGVVQRLFGVSLALDHAGDLSAAERRRAAREIQGALADLRTVVQRPLSRRPRATGITLAEECERLVALHTELHIVLHPLSDLAVPPHLEPLAQSVLVESIRNVHKHARPTKVGIRATRERGAFILEIDNDGLEAASGSTGMGLRLAAFSALQAGGFVEFGERETGVWKVRLVVPLDEPA